MSLRFTYKHNWGLCHGSNSPEMGYRLGYRLGYRREFAPLQGEAAERIEGIIGA